jgi:preprotein translocase subunit YajC
MCLQKPSIPSSKIRNPKSTFRNQNMILLQGAGGMSLIFPLAMFAVFFFFIIRPQMKRQKEQQAFADSIEKGREVVTASGIFGKITKIDGQIVTLQIADKVLIRVTKGSISKEMTEAFAGKSNETVVNG